METEKHEKWLAQIPEIRPEDFHWVVFGIGAGASLILIAAAYAIVRIADGMWASWQLPAILGIAWFVVVSVTAMLFSIKTVRQEMEKQQQSQQSQQSQKSS